MPQLLRVARLLEATFGSGSGSTATPPASTYNGLLLALNADGVPPPYTPSFNGLLLALNADG